jgi:hypothetical protein
MAIFNSYVKLPEGMSIIPYHSIIHSASTGGVGPNKFTAGFRPLARFHQVATSGKIMIHGMLGTRFLETRAGSWDFPSIVWKRWLVFLAFSLKPSRRTRPMGPMGSPPISHDRPGGLSQLFNVDGSTSARRGKLQLMYMVPLWERSPKTPYFGLF